MLKRVCSAQEADGTTGVIANVITVQQTQEMFNLTVSEAHTFYVGQNGWLVHNVGNNGVVTFYTVQTPVDAARIRSGGTP